MTRQKVSPDDWRRRGQERYLLNCRLVARAYAPYSERWDHDHCEFCGEKFFLASDGSGGALTSGFATEDGYRWICADCFGDFSDEFQWTLVKEAFTVRP